MHRDPKLLFNWVFLTGLLLLALNDHFLKWYFSNWLTGKLSDFIGLLILPMFVQFIFPKLKAYALVLCGLLFIFWKLPLSESFIALYNRFSIIPIVRTVDYTDLVALMILPLDHMLLKHIDRYQITSQLQLNPLLVLIPTSFIFMATSPPVSYHIKPNGDIHIGRSYKITASKEAILRTLKEEGYAVRPDTLTINAGSADYYLLENVVLNSGEDTISSIRFGFMGNRLLLDHVTLKGEFKISDWKELKRYSNHYKKLIKSAIIEEFK